MQRIEFIHSKNYLHRDIKPDNFLIGTGKRESLIYMIDFGLAKRYRDSKSGEHIPFRDKKNLTGTARYASIYTHLGYEQSRRDDLESLGFVMMYFNRGSLPWQGLQAKTKNEKYEKIKQKKVGFKFEELCRGYPEEFCGFLNYCHNLKFEEQPDYAYLRKLLKDLFVKRGYANDNIYEWSTLKPLPKLLLPGMDGETKTAPEPKHIIANDGVKGFL